MQCFGLVAMFLFYIKRRSNLRSDKIIKNKWGAGKHPSSSNLVEMYSCHGTTVFLNQINKRQLFSNWCDDLSVRECAVSKCDFMFAFGRSLYLSLDLFSHSSFGVFTSVCRRSSSYRCKHRETHTECSRTQQCQNTSDTWSVIFKDAVKLEWE